MATHSHACPSRILGKVDTPKPRDPKARIRALTRVHIQVRIAVQARARSVRFARGPMPQTVAHEFNAQCTSSVRNLSAEWGIAPSHRLAPSSVYVEDNLDRMRESRLDNHPGARPISQLS
ncbi:hypothetical protein CRG98_010457 [Punica granatum]|uniref:Uncharacterized protein n=1 Tax=Punica granatum TaxID=22663 RepID=A0A2I0KKV0_PUNGR|nr:hypothetical protein CRG98_010457 [Punica granatum]